MLSESGSRFLRLKCGAQVVWSVTEATLSWKGPGVMLARNVTVNTTLAESVRLILKERDSEATRWLQSRKKRDSDQLDGWCAIQLYRPPTTLLATHNFGRH